MVFFDKCKAGFFYAGETSECHVTIMRYMWCLQAYTVSLLVWHAGNICKAKWHTLQVREGGSLLDALVWCEG